MTCSVYNATDSSSDVMQSIDKLVDWSRLWQLQITLNKCHVLPIRASRGAHPLKHGGKFPLTHGIFPAPVLSLAISDLSLLMSLLLHCQFSRNLGVIK